MTKRVSLLLVALVSLAALLALVLTNQQPQRALTQSTPAAATAYGKLVIGDLEVNVTISKHAFQVSIPPPTGGGGTGVPEFEDLTMTKSINSSSPLLMTALAGGQHFPTAVVTVFKSNSTKTLVRYRLTDVMVGRLHQNGKKENLSLRYEEIQMTAGGVSRCWDVGQNTTC
jgi:type VI protein secretion system component Hcp